MDAVLLGRKKKAAWLSVMSNTSLVVLKLLVGVLTGSVSVISEAIHSGLDLVAALIALYAVRTSSAPADDKHPFGHGKIENISGAVEAVLITAAAIWIIYESVERFFHPKPLDTALLGIGVMAVSAVVNQLISSHLFKVGKESDSVALVADAWHLRTDVYTSGGVLLGLALIYGLSFFVDPAKVLWIDSVAAIMVALLILHASWELTTKAVHDLIDASLPDDELEWLKSCLLRYYPTAKGFHNLKTRKSGHVRFVEVHMNVDPGMTVRESHRVTERITEEVQAKFPMARVTIHVEPCEGHECKPNCQKGCLVKKPPATPVPPSAA